MTTLVATTPSVRPGAFGQRTLSPRVCIADNKPHIRTFLADAFEDLGFIAFECPRAADLKLLLEAQMFNLVVLGLSAGGIEAGKVLEALANANFRGKVMPVAVPDSILSFATRQMARELGIATLPTLPTPFSAETLRHSVASLIPTEAPPSPAVDVAEALKAGWLELWYQRKIDVRTLMPRGAEALIRMRHPTWGVVLPSSFIPDRRDTAFHNLSEFVIARVIDDWRYFIERNGPVDLAINLPASFLRDNAAVRTLCQRMPSHPAFGGLLIELKCAEVIDDFDHIADVARRIRFHNVAVSIKSVGAEWPALMGRQVFPFAELKVDRQYVTGFGGDRLKQTVCRGIIDLAEGYGVRTVAEGIESRADFLTAHQLGFDIAQGFLFGKAMAPRKFARTALTRPVTLP
ncbi:MAG: EAL domain-containing response regulator [Rhizobiales bacterium]|nr:EAL domain-containing response regulator [Hyphomicrobiales bacterium]